MTRRIHTLAPGERPGPFPHDDLDRCDTLMGVRPRPLAPGRGPANEAKHRQRPAASASVGISPIVACSVSYRFKASAPTLVVSGGLFAARAVPEGCCTFEEVVRAVLSAWPEVKRNDLLSDRRARTVVRPRQALYALLKEFTQWSLPRIGRAVDRDHTSILHGVRTAAMLCHEDAGFACAYRDARRACLGHIERRAAAERALQQPEAAP